MMNNSSYVRRALAQTAMDFVPPLIRETLLKSPGFRKEYGLKTESVLTLGDSGVEMHRTEILSAVRKILADCDRQQVSDKNGRVWNLKNESENGHLPKLVMSSGEQRFALPNFTVLSPNVAVRLQSLNDAAMDVNLPTGTQESWRAILMERTLNDDEVDTFLSEFRNTPVYFLRTIEKEIRKGKSTVASLVPCSRSYFENLVGVYDGSASVSEYAKGTGRQFIEQLSAWRPFEGFLLSLALSSHAMLTAEMGVERLSEGELTRAFQFIENHGDMLSKLGAIEIGLRILSRHPDIESVLCRLTKQIRDDDIEGPTSSFKLFAALYVLVDGELARSRLLCSAPPSIEGWRR